MSLAGGSLATMSRPARPEALEISRDELAEVITDAWCGCAPKRLVKAHRGG